jgi:hypothetical protein
MATAIRAKYRVCPICEGEGSYVDPQVDDVGITPQDFADDPEFEAAYFAGRYDVVCQCCNGRRVVTADELGEYRERVNDHRVMMAESGELYGDCRL